MRYSFTILFLLVLKLTSYSQRAKLYVGLPTKEYYKNGSLRVIRDYNDSQIQGYKTFYKSGQLRSNYVFDEKGRHDSIANFYYPNGNLKTIWVYKRDLIKKRTDFTLEGEKIKGKKDYDKIKVCSNILFGNRNNINALLTRASKNCKLGFHDESHEDFMYFLSFASPKQLTAWGIKVVYHQMAINYSAFEDYKNSLLYNFKVLAVKSNNQATINNIGEVFLKAGDYKQALKYADKCHEINPENYHSFFTKAKIYLDNGDIEKAYNFIQKTIADKRSHKLSTRHVEEEKTIWATRGEIFYRLKRYEEAIKDFEKALKENPVNSYALKYLAETYIKLNNIEESCPLLIKAKKYKYDEIYNSNDVKELIAKNCN